MRRMTVTPRTASGTEKSDPPPIQHEGETLRTPSIPPKPPGGNPDHRFTQERTGRPIDRVTIAIRMTGVAVTVARMAMRESPERARTAARTRAVRDRRVPAAVT